MGSSFVDDVDCGNFFDHIDDLIEFPPENECGSGLVSSDECKDFPSMWNEAIGDDNPLFPGCNSNSASDLSAELAVPQYEDIIPLEWLSTFMEDSFSGGGMTLAKDNSYVNEETSQNQFLTSSPVSVLESSSSSSSSSNLEIKVIPVTPNQCGAQRARSKRPRPATFSPRAAITSSFNDTHPVLVSGVPSGPESAGESKHARKWHETHMPEQKKKKIKPKVAPPTEVNQHTPAQAVRKCQHCEITKTPQWRAGPMGPKTLCNACGVRFKSGRLFPEYRPAASPTFVPTLHSNSHKKVVEMRTKFVEKNPLEGAAGSVSISSQGDIGPTPSISSQGDVSPASNLSA